MAKSDLVARIDSVAREFHGDVTELERAIGALFVGRQFGWKPLMLVHDKKTLRKYERILGINFREELDEVGPRGLELRAYRIALKLGNIWKAIKGEVPNVRGPMVD